MTKELVEAAAGYLSAGFEIIALTGKQPNTFFHPNGKDNAMLGVPEDEADDAEIERVFTHPTTSGVGILIPPHRVVVDIDGEEGAVSLKAILDDDPGGFRVFETPTASTGRGMHLWFSTYREKQGSTKLGEKLDLKGVGGYVAAPPSRHPSGAVYRWLDDLVDAESGQPQLVCPLPTAIEAILQSHDDLAAVHIERPKAWGLKAETIDGRLRFVRTQIVGNLDGIVKRIKDEPEGNRNGILFWAACKAREEGVGLEIALRDLVEASIVAGLPRHEATGTVKSAYRRKR